MLAIKEYLETIKDKVETKRTKSSKLKNQLLEIVKENIENGEPNTFKNLTERIGHKHQSYIRQLVAKNSDAFNIVKVNGVSVVLPTVEEE